MGYNPMEVNQAARKAAKLLGESGAAGSTSKEWAVIAPEGSMDSNAGLFGTTAAPIDLGLVVGNTYKVCFADKVYICVAEQFIPEEPLVWLMCDAVWDGEDLAEGFVIYGGAGIMGDNPAYFAMMTVAETAKCAVDENGYVTNLSIYEETETIHPINPKYLPKGGVGYEESGNVILAGQTLEFATDDDEYIYAKVECGALAVGKTYKVTFDGASYTVVAKPYNDILVYLGNLSLGSDGIDTGEAFLIGDFSPMGTNRWNIYTNSTGTHTIAVSESVIHPIDPKFIPGVCLPVVELSTVLTKAEEPTALNADDVAKLNSVAESSEHIIVRYHFNSFDYPLAALLCRFDEAGEIGYSGALSVMVVVLIAVEGVWYYLVQ